MTLEGLGTPTPQARWYRSPFVIAFVLGAIALTAMPFLSRLFLSAPAPISMLPRWALVELSDGSSVTSETVAQHVLLLRLASSPCDAACLEQQHAFGRMLEHTDDFGDAIVLLTLVMPGAEPDVAPLSKEKHGRWYIAGGSAAQVEGLVEALREGWNQWAKTDAGATPQDFAKLPAIILVDRRGQLRGFWRDDVKGYGNAVNAARLLARYPGK